MLDCLVVDRYEVVAKIDMPDGARGPILLPFYDAERFPFAMVRGKERDFFVVNLKEMTSQVLIRADHDQMQGFCVKIGDRAFAFHFCSKMLEEDGKKSYEYHHLLRFTDDAISIMERCGQLPFKTKEEHASLIEANKSL